MIDAQGVESGGGVTVEQFRRAVGLLDGEAWLDELAADLLPAAVVAAETAARRVMVPRPFQFSCPVGTWVRWWFPVAPVSELVKVEWRPAGGDWVEVEAGSVELQCGESEPQIALLDGLSPAALGAAEFRVAAECGSVDFPAPVQLTRAALMIAKSWMDAGLAVEASDPPEVPFGVDRLIRQVRYSRPRVASGV